MATKRFKMMLTEDEATVIQDLRRKKSDVKRQRHPLEWNNRPWCAICSHKKAAPVIGATLCTWCSKTVQTMTAGLR